MVDLFGANSENYRTFEGYCNDRVKLSNSMAKIVSMQNFTAQFAALKADLGRAEDLLCKQEDLKRNMLENRQGVPDLDKLISFAEANLDASEEVIIKLEPNVSDGSFSNGLSNARQQRTKLQATNPGKAKSTAAKSDMQLQ